MAIVLSEKTKDALKPLYKPWEEPSGYRVPGKDDDSPGHVEPGRRPSRCPLVRSIRSEVDLWRRGGYAGVSKTSRYLLNYWFNTDHMMKEPSTGESLPFRYHWAQREAIESIIYIYELRRVRNVAALLSEFGDNVVANLALGINPQDDQWVKACCKIATGGGKTKVMSLAIVWSYFNALFETDTELVKHFVVIAPNLTVYERLKVDFYDKNRVFDTDPLIPEEWKGEFQVETILQDEPGGDISNGAIYLTNIHRLYETRDENSSEDDEGGLWGPEVKRNKALDTSVALRERISKHKGIMVLNDEAHHLHDPELKWNKALESLHTMSLNKGFQGVQLQLDFTATPKHNNGDYFRHIVCDFPLGEAVDAGIVKVPVISESNKLLPQGDSKTPAHQKFRQHLQAGYETYKSAYEEWNLTRKPILFVMTEDSTAANEIAKHLDSDTYPLLKGRVLNIHTKLKGRIKKYYRFGKEIKEFVENESAMKPEDLQILREMSRELDSPNSKFRCVVSVIMLREGWDIRNVTTIVPLRAFSSKSGILPEQTLGRGLRRMVPNSDVPEVLTVIHHPAFRDLYDEELQLEGFNIIVDTGGSSIRQTVSIFVDRDNKDIENLDISIPSVSDAIETSSKLENLSMEEILEEFKKYKPLPLGKIKQTEIEFKERLLFTKEVINTWKLDVGLLNNGWSAPQYFALMLARGCKLTEYQNVLLPLLTEFISKHLFENEIYLFDNRIAPRLRELDVQEHILAVFSTLIMDKKTTIKNRKSKNTALNLSEWKPYQASSSENRPAVPANRTMFNLVTCDNPFEAEFANECDIYEDVEAFARNAGPQKLAIDYLKPDKHRALYIPDFFVRVNTGEIFLCELKGREDNLVPLKARAALEWCKSASKAGVKWRYLYIPYNLFQNSTATSLQELARACEPSLQTLIKDSKTDQLVIDFDQIESAGLADPLFMKIKKDYGVEGVPEDIKERVGQALLLIDHAERGKMPTFAHAFQPLLSALDEYALRMLVSGIKEKIPTNLAWRDAYFQPDTSKLDFKKRKLVEKYGRYLSDNLIYARSMMKLGTLLFCLEYAQKGGFGLDGVWKDVLAAWSGEEYSKLYDLLSDVNNFRNTRIAHVEVVLSDIEEAWDNMGKWIKCLVMMR